MWKKIKSRKLWITIATQALIIAVVTVFDIPEEQAETIVMGLVGTAGSFLIGQGIADHPGTK